MINAITGLPGEGKTCFSVQHIILKELMLGERPIFGNVAWHNEEVVKFCKTYGYDVDPTRLHLVNEEDIGRFWEVCPKNCLIVLDEVAEYFNSSAWKEIGSKAGAYARQHRKLGHETYLIVQDLNHIYKQFRDMVFEEIRIMNLSTRRWGPFRLPKFFLAKWILKDSRQVHRSRLYRFNTEVFSTYSTLATVGGLLETGEEVEVKKTTSKLTWKDAKRRFFGFCGSHWLALTLSSLVMILIFLPKYLFNSFTGELKESEEIVETDKTEETEETNAISDMRNALPFADMGKTKERELYNLGRYDTKAKRSIRAEDSLR